MRTVVISQPMFFPWVGMFEQMRLADAYVHLDDAQYSKGSFTNRVQIKTSHGPLWLTVPLKDVSLGALIMEAPLDDRRDWRKTHLSTLSQAYARSPFKNEMLDLVQQVYAQPAGTICDLAIASMTAIHGYFRFPKPTETCFSSRLNIPGRSSTRVLDLVRALGGSVYVTGHGARQYLDHEHFERAGVSVEYLDYQKTPYPQLHGDFTPFVSALDLIANCGRDGVKIFASPAISWRTFCA
jgi:WbqC-like protein family